MHVSFGKYIINLAYLMLQPFKWPFSGRCVSKGGYINILQKFVHLCTDVKY
jgi:hypothetical protein